MTRILIAMSGGVDSSVAAARLVHQGRAQGHEVVGVTLHLWDYPDDGSVRGRCCAPEDLHDARRVADRLGIPHYAYDRRELFAREVVAPFVDAYLEGKTPSPCVHCNRGVKMRELFQIAADLDADRVATGHYARVDRGHSPARLLRARDRSKDQSYFLHVLGPEALERLVFPLGDSDKGEVRAEARALGLPGADKGESQELCFVPEGRYEHFVSARAGDRLRPGPIVDESGVELGRHEGIHRFTIGQRRHLGVSLGERRYVVGVDARDGRVQLGKREALEASGARLEALTLAADDVALPVSCEVQVRYRGRPHRASVVQADGAVEIHFEASVQAVVPGQVAVLYDGERVLGGGTIERALHAASAPTPPPPSAAEARP